MTKLILKNGLPFCSPYNAPNKCRPCVFVDTRPTVLVLLSCKPRPRTPSRAPTPAGILLPLLPGMCPCRPARAGSPHTRSFICSPTHTLPPTYPPAPTPEVERGLEEPERGGATRSRRKQRGAGRCRGGSRRSRFVTGGPFRRWTGPKRRNRPWSDRSATRNGPPPPRCRA